MAPWLRRSVFLLLILSIACLETRTSPKHPPESRPTSGEELGRIDPNLPFRRGVLQASLLGEGEVFYQVVDGRAIFQGDIDLGPVDAEGNLLPSGQRAVGTTKADLLWPGCVVRWEFDTNVPAGLRANIRAAINAWQAATDCTFPELAGPGDRVHFFLHKDKNSSPVGRVGGQQVINLTNGASAATAMHEIGHALGLLHEHTRHDRDDFITVNWAAITGDERHNYEIRSDSQDIGVYNYKSIMHYGMGGPPAKLTPPRGITIGGASSLHPGDISGVQELYGMLSRWQVFRPQNFSPIVTSPPAVGPHREQFFYYTRGGANRLCRRHDSSMDIMDCITSGPPEPLSGIPAATLSPSPPSPGEVSVFVRGASTGSYLHYRRDYKIDAAGGRFTLETATAGSGWLSSPAGLTLGSRALVFGVRGREDPPTENALHMVYNDFGDSSWSRPIEILMPGGITPAFEPAVVESHRPGTWALFTFATDGSLWACEGDRDGNIVTPWVVISFLRRGRPLSGPAVTQTNVSGFDYMVFAQGQADHLWVGGVGRGFNLDKPWVDTGGLLNGRPAATTFTGGDVVGVFARIQDDKIWYRQWEGR
jgi:hypothetical protein